MSTTLVNPTVQEVLQAVRRILKQPDPQNSFWTDEELLAYINEGVRIHFAELTAIDEGHFVTTTNLDITQGAEEITLPADFFKVRALYKKLPNEYAILPYRNTVNEGYFTDGGTNSNTYLPYYFFRQNKLCIRPVPNFTETTGLRLEYIQFPETLLNGSDQVTAQISPVFRQVIEMYAVYKAKVSESLVTGTRTHDVAAENLRDLVAQFKELNAIRSKNPTFIQPWNPEGF